MDTNQTLILKNDSTDSETGLAIKERYKASSGLIYARGLRDFNGLKIIEGVAKGTANIFLTSIIVLDQKGDLIYDAEIEKFTNYSREKVRQSVLHGLASMISDASQERGETVDELELYEKLDKKLKTAFYEQSYRSVLDWAKEINLIN